MLTSFDLDDHVIGALRAGAAGFLLKTVDGPVLVDAVQRVARGEGVLAPEVTRAVLARAAATPAGAFPGTQADSVTAAAAAVARLSAREREVLAALARGLTNAGIARELVVSDATAKTHVSSVLAKLGCTSRVQAALIAREAGLI